VSYALDDLLLARLFPFHLVLDPQLRIVKRGPSLSKIDPSLEQQPQFSDRFRIQTPRIEPDFEALRARASNRARGHAAVAPAAPSRAPDPTHRRLIEAAGKSDVLYVLDHVTSGLSFRMQLLASDDPPRLLFVGSPLLTTRAQLDRYSLTLSDFAPFDCSLDYLLALRMKDSLIERTTRLTSELEVMNHDLQEQVEAGLAADQAKDLFLTTMSHEIRTPMNAITGLTSLLLRMEPVAARRHHLVTIETAANTLQALIDGILDFSKVESGSLDQNTEDFDLHEAVRQAVRLFAPVARKKTLELRLTIDERIPRAVRGDPALFNRVLSNLTHNAIKFTDAGWVEIAVTARSHTSQAVMVRVEITDTGIGIAAADRDRIFERFTQVNDVRSHGLGGSGLGLAISRKICEACGGRIDVESTPGKGSMFWFEFPLEMRSDVRGPAPPAAEPPPTPSVRDELEIQRPVLVVEDNTINRNMIVDMLEWLGVETQSAVDGEAALECTAHRDFGAILMDIQMPGMDGYETVRKIRLRGERNADTPIVGLSANAFPKDREAGIAAGMNDYLAKPITIDSLVKTLQRWHPPRSASANSEPRESSTTTTPLSSEARDLLAGSPLLETEDDSPLLEYLNDFLTLAPDTLTCIGQALERGSFDEVSRHAHNLKGSSLFLSLDTLTSSSEQLESAAQQRDAKEVTALLSRIQGEINEIARTLELSPPSFQNEDHVGAR
jgi:signal transduction histidine kinase/CheY-like chemotaxis protein/HPt (histidine-containing phosphotransfer) domain-containing protein